jgi:hypothetical protein
MAGYNCWTKHGERGVMMEDGEEEENDEKYRQIFPEYGDTAMKTVNKKEVTNGHQLSPLMILVGSFLMRSETVKQKRRGCSSSRCYRT